MERALEIGGYLEYERYHGKAYHTDCLKLNSGRNCLKYLIEARNIERLWISRWNCSAVLDTCLNSGVDIKYFDLDDRLAPIIPSNINPGEYLYVVNYFGQLPSIHYENMILDNAQAFFQKPFTGIDTIYTCRKFFGVTDGAYLYSNTRLGRALKFDESYSRLSYLAGRFERSASEFYSKYHENESMHDSLPLKIMSRFTENVMNSIDYEYVRRKREENFQYLHSKLGQFNRLPIIVPKGPFAYPLYVKCGEQLRKKLQTNKIYVAKLWPNVVEGIEGEYSDNILPIPCDQRYTTGDMDYICDCIKECM